MRMPRRALARGCGCGTTYLDESHEISQSIDTPVGSYWHGIMHRREGDFSNAGYWFRLAGKLDIFDTLAAHASEIVRDLPADKRLLPLTLGGWEPTAFVKLTQAAYEEGPASPLWQPVVLMQQAEWRVLFDWCVRAARG